MDLAEFAILKVLIHLNPNTTGNKNYKGKQDTKESHNELLVHLLNLLISLLKQLSEVEGSIFGQALKYQVFKNGIVELFRLKIALILIEQLRGIIYIWTILLSNIKVGHDIRDFLLK